MDTTTLSSPADLSDQDLLARTLRLAADERQATALLIAHLAELDARRLHLAEGYSSLFSYCTQVLRLSEHAAYGRIEAARAARRFPLVLEMLSEGSVTLTTVGLLAPHLTTENHRDLLDRARHQSKRAVEELIAGICPQPAVPAVVRRLPAGRPPASPSPALADGADAGAPGPVTATPPVASPSPGRPATVAQLAPARYKVQFTASAETYEKLRLAQDLLRHQIPDGDLDQILSRALTALLEALARQKFAATDRPRRGQPTAPGARHIPAEVKRAVWLRDGGRCAFLGPSGRRCTATGFLEFHHVQPHAVGGESTIDNIQLRCRAHNAYEAELSFGPSTLAGVRETPTCYSVRTEFGHIIVDRLLKGTTDGPSGAHPYGRELFHGGRGPERYAEDPLEYRNLPESNRFDELRGYEGIRDGTRLLFWHRYAGFLLMTGLER